MNVELPPNEEKAEEPMSKMNELELKKFMATSLQNMKKIPNIKEHLTEYFMKTCVQKNHIQRIKMPSYLGLFTPKPPMPEGPELLKLEYESDKKIKQTKILRPKPQIDTFKL